MRLQNSRFFIMKEEFFRRELDNLKPYEPGKPIFEVKREFGLDEIIKLASNETPLEPFPCAVDAIKESISELNRYPDGGGTILREKLASNFNIPIDNIVLGNGSNEIELLLGLACLNPLDEVVYPWPSFVVYPMIPSLMGCVGVAVPLREHRNDVKALASAVTDRTKLLFTCSPNNPTGTIITKDEAAWLMDNVSQDVLVVFDEAYIEFADDANAANGLDLFGKYENIVVLRTFSKIFGLAGLRIGYGIGPVDVITALNKVRAPFNVNTLAQVGAAACIDDFTEIGNRKRFNIEEKRYFYAGLDRLGLSYIPSQANFILIDTGKSSREIFMDLLKKGVIVRSGDALGYDNWIRVTVGTRAENDKFLQEIANII